jgi:hypothetical protein
MKALIETAMTIRRRTGYDSDGVSIMEEIPNSARIAQIAEDVFDVAAPLFWVDCDDSITTTKHYYDTSDSSFKLINNATKDPSIFI